MAEVREQNADKYCQSCKEIVSNSSFDRDNNSKSNSNGKFGGWDSLGKGNRLGGK